MSLSKKDLRKRAKLEKMGIDVMSMNEPGDNSRKEKKRKMQDAAINDGIPDSGDEEWNGLDARSRRIIKARILMNKRDKARDESNFALSDAIREKLKGMGIEVKDQKNGPSGWKFTDGSSTKLAPDVKVPEAATRKKLKVKQDAPQSKSPNSSINSEQSRNKKVVEIIQGNANKVMNVHGVNIEDIEIGSGAMATSGMKVKVFYVGKLKTTGKVFDSSTKRPFSFKLGRSEVIRGWDVGVEGMRVGGRRKLTIPPEKAYGRKGAPPDIPGNATLIFDIQLIGV